jgi:hypothetical protein
VSPHRPQVPTYLHEHGLEVAGVATVWQGTVLLLVGQVDTGGTVQLLQLTMAALLLGHPVGRVEAGPGLWGWAATQDPGFRAICG